MQIRTNPLKGNMTWDIKQVMSIGERSSKRKKKDLHKKSSMSE